MNIGSFPDQFGLNSSNSSDNISSGSLGDIFNQTEASDSGLGGNFATELQNALQQNVTNSLPSLPGLSNASTDSTSPMSNMSSAFSSPSTGIESTGSLLNLGAMTSLTLDNALAQIMDMITLFFDELTSNRKLKKKHSNELTQQLKDFSQANDMIPTGAVPTRHEQTIISHFELHFELFFSQTQTSDGKTYSEYHAEISAFYESAEINTVDYLLPKQDQIMDSLATMFPEESEEALASDLLESDGSTETDESEIEETIG